jgi:DNA-binding MarR family transcriptional regulator
MNSKEIVILLIKTNSILSERLSHTLKPHGVTIQQFNVLRILRGQKGKAANLSTVQNKMLNKMSNTTRLVDKLINKSLVNRTICKENRRKIELYITEGGLNMLEILDPIVEKTEKEFIQILSSHEKNEIGILLKKIIKTNN